MAQQMGWTNLTPWERFRNVDLNTTCVKRKKKQKTNDRSLRPVYLLAISYSSLRSEYHEQLKGAQMGNNLSPFIIEIFMANLEMDLALAGLILKFWEWYADDIYVVIRKK